MTHAPAADWILLSARLLFPVVSAIAFRIRTDKFPQMHPYCAGKNATANL
jgi:hypothetical protein